MILGEINTSANEATPNVSSVVTFWNQATILLRSHPAAAKDFCSPSLLNLNWRQHLSSEHLLLNHDPDCCVVLNHGIHWFSAGLAHNDGSSSCSSASCPSAMQVCIGYRLNFWSLLLWKFSWQTKCPSALWFLTSYSSNCEIKWYSLPLRA